ncbi:MAG: hypothetical protein GDA65_07210 [Nitrospira sp. CR1.1]|jgi:membrane associated rhomboid family serine protease|nr:hypothetical protein [Nitrospira sp. CR1.1]
MTQIFSTYLPGAVVALLIAVVLFLIGHVEKLFFRKMQFEIATWIFALLFFCAFVVGNEWLDLFRWVAALAVLIVGAVVLYRYERDYRR